MKHYLYTLLILSLFSCDKEEPEKPNTSPKVFEVTAKVEGTDVTLTWREAVDADGDAVTYAVVYGDTLAKGLTAKTHTIKNLPYETEIGGTVVASDGKGGKTEQGFKVKTLESEYVLISDKKFEELLVKLKIDDVLDGKILRLKTNGVKSLSIGSNSGVVNLQGLEAFRDLEILIINKNNLEELNISKSRKLKRLEVLDTKIEKLDLSENLFLERLKLSGKEFSDINLSNNKELLEFTCENTSVKSLNFERNVNLKIIDLSENKNLTELNISKNVKLEALNISFNLLNYKVLDLSEFKLLRSLAARNLNVEKIDLSKNVELRSLYLFGASLKEVHLKNNVELVNLDLLSSRVQGNLDLSMNNKLEYIDLRTLGSIGEVCLTEEVFSKRGSLNIRTNRNTIVKVCD